MLSGAGVCQEGGTIFSFSRYTSEQYISDVQGHGSHSREVVFDNDHLYSESAYLNDISYAYSYYNGGDHIGSCQHVGDHNNCFVHSGTSQGTLTVNIQNAQSVPCPVIEDPILGGPKRKLQLCHYYQKDLSSTKKAEYWIEYGTHYPVRTVYKTKELFQNPSYQIIDYCTFEETVPNDRSKLSPIPGVKVYDFRIGKEGIFSESENQVPMSLQSKGNHTKKDGFVSDGMETMIGKHFGFVGPSMGPAPVHTISTRDAIPESFDAREKWSKCSVIKEIKNQGGCGSCWAMASSSALADRVCIYTHGATDVSLSPQFMVNCLPNQCGCHGGRDEPMWKDLMDIGTVPESCLPFHQKDDICTGRCDDGRQIPKYTKAKNIYSPWGETDKKRVEAIQREIMEHGSVTASFFVFSDWVLHWFWPNPVYHRSSTAKLLSGHAVRIIGWGREKGEDYWLIANSHGTNFREGGFFKMRRGINECNIEETVIAGEPLID